MEAITDTGAGAIELKVLEQRIAMISERPKSNRSTVESPSIVDLTLECNSLSDRAR